MKYFLAIPLLIALARFGVYAIFNPVGRGMDMADQVQGQTMTGANAIEQYEWFKRTSGRINSLYAKEVLASQAINPPLLLNRSKSIFQSHNDDRLWKKETDQEIARRNERMKRRAEKDSMCE